MKLTGTVIEVQVTNSQILQFASALRVRQNRGKAEQEAESDF